MLSVLSSVNVSSTVPGEDPIGEVGNFFTDLWNTVINFFKNNGIDLVIRVAAALLIIFVGHFLVKLIDRLVIGSLKASRRRKGKRSDTSMFSFASSCLKFVLNMLLLFLVLSVLNIPLDNVFSILSAAVLAIGLALQDLLANFANGVVLLTSHQFKSGDHIVIGDQEGIVEEINMMTTVIKSFDNRRIVIPNSTIAKGTIVNNTYETTRRVTIDIGFAYGTDVERARKVMLAAALKDPRVLDDPAPSVPFTAYNDSSINLSLRCWCLTEHYWDLLFDLNEAIYNDCGRYGLEIAFPQLDVHMDKKAPTVAKTDLKSVEKLLSASARSRAQRKVVAAEEAAAATPVIKRRGRGKTAAKKDGGKA